MIYNKVTKQEKYSFHTVYFYKLVRYTHYCEKNKKETSLLRTNKKLFLN